MIHERPGVWSAFGAQGTTELTDRRLAAVIAPADAAEGVQLVHSAAEAVSLYGGNALLTRMLKLCLANCGDPVYAVAVDEDTKVAYETALTALFTAAKPGILIVGSAREDVQLLLRDLRAALAARFRAAQNSTLTRTAIRSAVLLVLQDYRARGWLSAFGDLRVYADAGDASLCRVEFTYSIPAGLHRIALSAQMTG